MARRKSFSSFGPKRKSYGKAFRVNTKGVIPTSVSVGGKTARINMGRKGTRMTTRNPITGKRTSIEVGSGKQSGKGRPVDAINQKSKKGCGCMPLPFLVVMTLVIAGVIVL
jgi:hypothetical protein